MSHARGRVAWIGASPRSKSLSMKRRKAKASDRSSLNAGTRTAPRRCFVISPIGPEGSETREHADDVFDFIIEPAARRAQYEAHRGDHSAKSGKITEQMFDAILRDTFVIAVLTFHNPNVFYELAIAQAAARPVILLIERGTTLPFDIQELRVIFYDLRPRSIKTDVYVDALYKAIGELEAGGMKGEVPFDPSLSPLGSNNRNFSLLERTANLREADHVAVVRDTKKQLLLSGMALFFSWHNTAFQDALREKANVGCPIKILIMHEDNPALQSMLNMQIEDHFKHAVTFIKSSMKKWSALARSIPTLEIRKVRTGIIYFRSTINESEALITPHLYSIASITDCPLIRVPSVSALYSSVVREFDSLWEANAAHSNRRGSSLALVGDTAAASG
jgi:hypothetical protein